MSIQHLLNQSLEVWRAQTVPDGSGGQETVMVQLGTVPARLSQPSADERIAADQAGADLSHIVYVPPGADVRRGDELRQGARVLEVLATVTPSEPIYLRVETTLRQAEGG